LDQLITQPIAPEPMKPKSHTPSPRKPKAQRGSIEKSFDSPPLPGDQKIEVSLTHRTLIIVKNPGQPTVMEICVVGAPGTRDDAALVDISPGKGNAIDIFCNLPKELISMNSLPVSELEESRRKIAK
jgi:hypothetical protein